MVDEFHVSPSGVQIAKDFRSNLIIDRYDPIFADMRASKIKHLCSVNSEDAVTWNVFRSLRQITPDAWLPNLWRHAFPSIACPAELKVVIRLWEPIPPPPGLLESGDEGISEIDVVIDAPTWLWFIEAKYRSDISRGTKTRPDRDQVLRNIDVGSFSAGVRDFYFSLLILSEEKSSEGAKKVREYADLSVPRAKLKEHRPDGLQNLRAVGLLSWGAFFRVLDDSKQMTTREDELGYAERAVKWLQKKEGFPSAP